MVVKEDVIRIVNSAHERRLAQAEENRKIMQGRARRTLISMAVFGIIVGITITGMLLGIVKLLAGVSLAVIAPWFIPSLLILSMAAGMLAQKYIFCKYEAMRP